VQQRFKQIVGVVILLLPLLPERYREMVLTGFTVLGANTALLVAVSNLLGDPKPSDGQVRQWIYRAVHFLEYAAANVEPMKAKLQRTGSTPPGPISINPADVEDVP
jgi:hypothetical protein